MHAPALTVSPLPGTPDASSTTQISFLSGPGTRVSDVAVRGSLSGRHGGRLEAYSTGTGESFLPSRPFAPGERVSVSARVRRGTAAWQTVSTHFRVAVQAPISQAQFPPDPGDPADVQHYISAPPLSPSTVAITTPAAVGATPGDFFLAPYQGAGTAGPMIVDQSGGLIWFDPLPAGLAATDFRTQTYDGRSVLTWWQGRILKLGFGQGRDEIYDSSYQPIAQVTAGNGYAADLHQFLLTRSGTAWIDAVDPVERESSRPDFQIVGYPAIPKNLTFAKGQPPAFLFCGNQDRPNISDGLATLYLEMKKAGINAELHIYASVGHGFGLRDGTSVRIAGWPARLKEWMIDLKLMNK